MDNKKLTDAEIQAKKEEIYKKQQNIMTAFFNLHQKFFEDISSAEKQG